MNSFPSISEQRITFDALRSSIDKILRVAGFEEVLLNQDIDASFGRIVIARSFQYSSELATIDRDLEPLATMLETQYEVGVSEESHGSRFYQGILVGNFIYGESGIQYETTNLNFSQRVVFEASIARLLKARQSNPWITKSLLKVDSAGD